MLGIGIDFGTSNSSAAIYDGRSLRYVDVDPVGPDREVMPTALYLDRSLRAKVGKNAISAYMRENEGRAVALEREAVGEIEITVAGGAEEERYEGPNSQGGTITDNVQVFALTDRALPGRLFRGLKRWLGNSALERVRVFDKSYRIVALITPILQQLRQATARRAGSGRSAINVGRPVRFEGRGPDADDVASRRLLEACGYAGLCHPNLTPEPVAAALSFLHKSDPGSDQTIVAFDFGGGTLDLSVVRALGGRFELLATTGIAIGGDAIDRAIYRDVIFPELGRGALVRVPIGPDLVTTEFHFDPFAERLLNWPLAYELNRAELREQIVQGIREGGGTARRLGRLYQLVTRNQSYRVFQAVERAKVELSSAKRAALNVPELDLSVSLTRARFEKTLRPFLREIRQCVQTVLARARLGPEDITRVVRTGGSSRIPAVVRLLEEIFGGRVVEHDPFTSIAAGLALASFHGYIPPAGRVATG